MKSEDSFKGKKYIKGKNTLFYKALMFIFKIIPNFKTTIHVIQKQISEKSKSTILLGFHN